MKRGLKQSNQTRKFGNRSSTGPQGSVTKAIVFDLGGVLVDLHSVDARRELIDDYGMPAERFDRLTRSCFTQPRRSITELAMIGRASTSEYLSSFSRECRRKDIDGMRNNRLSVLGRERRAVFDIVNQLKESGTTCCILSNTIALHWEKLESRCEYPSLSEFDHIFASHLIQRAKPRRNAFFFVAEALKIHMSECLLIDDTALNVDGARRAGWSGLLFTDAATLRRDLGVEVAGGARHDKTERHRM